ncbi:hypothetical protein [Cellulomonas xiejunii]|uniref:Uncharacterized protein n=1 Tax=Cellulomonas xiejunii TaxID=2968083 RepID=A0ABY5KPK1_9CELL|nr:hypothetical protein [Cellulomonas xiejunii]MCC2320806.1 hypothetical protein [Cellulomonas xiejunii]UUI71092.1 hypothetical protein NP048_15020 [Cellulomonas xiejunii]
MKPTAVIVSDPATISVIHGRLREIGSYVEREFFDTLVTDECTLGVDASGAVLIEYDEAELESLRSRFGDIAAILFEYESVGCFQRIVGRAVEGLEGIVDDNSGRLREFSVNSWRTT